MLTSEATGGSVPTPMLVINGSRIAGNQFATLNTRFAKDPVKTFQAIRLIVAFIDCRRNQIIIVIW